VVSYRSGREIRMYSASRGIRAVILLFASCLSGTIAFSQGVNFIRHVADPLPHANLRVSRAPCAADSGRALSNPNSLTPATGESSSPCDTPPVSALTVNPCGSASPVRTGCNPPRDLVQEDLATRGKPGQKIQRARERVLEILQTENACSAWFREKDSNPAATFRTLNFEIDRNGEDSVRESKGSGGMSIFRSPYVARVIQADGSHGTITINTKGAFFSPVAMLFEVQWEGGPLMLRGTRSIGVGPYEGDTFHAQILALLHEFGHIVDLLPTDEDDRDGKSVQNTGEVLRFCRAEVELKGKRATLAATR
jgi:hypothetical protein